MFYVFEGFNVDKRVIFKGELNYIFDNMRINVDMYSLSLFDVSHFNM